MSNKPLVKYRQNKTQTGTHRLAQHSLCYIFKCLNLDTDLNLGYFNTVVSQSMVR